MVKGRSQYDIRYGGYKQHIAAASGKEFPVKQMMDGTLRAAAGTMKACDGVKQAFREEGILCRVIA